MWRDSFFRRIICKLLRMLGLGSVFRCCQDDTVEPDCQPDPEPADYIPDVDELILPPPYNLGTDSNLYRVESHHFLLDSDPIKLQALADKHLNAVFASPHQARASSGCVVKLTYTVKNTASTMLSLLRYWRVNAVKEPGKGELAYTEAILSFPVVRWRDDSPDLGEALEFAALIYIDDTLFDAPVCDPFSIPIIFGRELFGLPKAPGQIAYRPNVSDYAHPKVQIWDYPSGGNGGRMELEDAIVFDPGEPWVPPGGSCPDLPTAGPLSPPTGNADTFHAEFNAKRWGLPKTAFRDLSGAQLATYNQWWADAHPRMSLPEFPRLQVADVDGKGVVFNQSYHLNSKLVALKQFPDPAAEFDPSTETGMKACYQAVVETAIEEFEGDRVTDWSVGREAVIEFPLRSRVDIIEAFGLETILGNDRRVEVTPDKMEYRFGRMLFARPSQTTVWKVV